MGVLGDRLVTVAARVAVVGLLASSAAIVGLGRTCRRLLRLRDPVPGDGGERVLITGTFYNVGWYRSHVMPLARCPAIEKVIVVCDEPLFPIDKVIYAAPPKWLSRICGGKVARLLWVARAARTQRATVLMGYHIMPNALLCLATAAWFGGRSCYQMTGGPVQIVDGGCGSENFLLRRQRHPSRLAEKLLHHLVRRFDTVVVRGEDARRFLLARGLARQCLVIPGSVDVERFTPPPPSIERAYDLVAVGRLVDVKRIDRLLDVAAALAGKGVRLRFALVGDGPLREALEAQAQRLAISDCITFLGRRDDVPQVLQASRAFLLTSENEGLSIAMMEAMAAGLPAMVPLIGDLPELVEEGVTGLFIDPVDPAAAAAAIADLFADPQRLAEMGETARERVTTYAGVAAVAWKWAEGMGTRPAADEAAGQLVDSVPRPAPPVAPVPRRGELLQ